MAWGRCDDNFWRHPKVKALDPDHRLAAVGLFWLAVAYANDRTTDGWIDRRDLPAIYATKIVVSELIRVGLWEQAGINYQIHDFLHFNRSRAQIEDLRRKRSAAGSKGAVHRWKRADLDALVEVGRKVTERKALLDDLRQKRSAAGRKGAAHRWNREDLDALATLDVAVTDKRKALLDDILDREGSASVAAAIIRDNPRDPIAAVIAWNRATLDGRREKADREERAWEQEKAEERAIARATFERWATGS